MMHRSHKPPRYQLSGWRQDITTTNQSILCNVGKGWFSLAEYRDGGWPFWSHTSCSGDSNNPPPTV